MQKFIPFEKLSKKKQRELNARQRGDRGGLTPVTRRPAEPRAYNRRKARKWRDDPDLRAFYYAVNVIFSLCSAEAGAL